MTGKVRSIGVSNFSQKKLEEILPTAEIIPAVDQVRSMVSHRASITHILVLQLEIHLYNPQHELITYLQSKGIVAQAYSPLGSTGSPLLEDEVAQSVAKKHGLQTADVLLGWLGKDYTLRVRLCKAHP